LFRGDGSRLYLAEGVCAAFEVKSDLSKEWGDVTNKARRIKALKRQLGLLAMIDPYPPDSIPFFAVGYSGWSTFAAVEEKLATAPEIDGILVIGLKGIYRGQKHSYSAHNAEGPEAIYGLLLSIEQLTSSMLGAKPEYGKYLASSN